MQIIAHRGAKGYVPDNTLASFAKALEMGADGIELDVRMSLDGHLLVFHDEHTDRLTGTPGAVSDMLLVDLRKLYVDFNHPIPTLEEVLDLVDARCLVNIELKVPNAVGPVCDLIEKSVSERRYNYEHFLVSSFDWAALKEIRERNPEIPLGVLTETDLNLALGFARSIKAETFHPYFHLVDETSVRQIKAENMRLYVWTVNIPEDIARMKAFDVNGIITDFPDRI